MIEKITEYDKLDLYCSKLGHEVPFKYCRTMNNNLPCRNILGCWERTLGDSFFVFYTKEELTKIFAPPKSKLMQILEVAERTKKNQ